MTPSENKTALVALASTSLGGTSIAIGLFVVAFLAADQYSPAFFVAGIALLVAVNLAFLIGMWVIRRARNDTER